MLLNVQVTWLPPRKKKWKKSFRVFKIIQKYPQHKSITVTVVTWKNTLMKEINRQLQLKKVEKLDETDPKIIQMIEWGYKAITYYKTRAY